MADSGGGALGRVLRHRVEDGVEHAAHRRAGQHRGVLGMDVRDVRAEPLDAVDRLHLLPEQVRGVEVHADVRRLHAVQELLEGGRGEDEVAGVHLEGELDVVRPGEGVDLLPEGHRDGPLVVQDLEVDAVPRVHDPGRAAGTGIGAGGAGHRDHVAHAERPGQLDRASQVVGVREALGGQRRERVAGDGQTCQLHALVGEEGAQLAPPLLADQQRVDVRVRGGDEAAGVELGALQARGGEHVEGVGQGAVLQAGGVGAVGEGHGGDPFASVGRGQSTWMAAPPRSADSATAPRMRIWR